MPNRFALLIAVDQPLWNDFARLPYRESGVAALAELLLKVGYSSAHLSTLIGPYATYAAIESQIEKLKKTARKGDSMLLVLAGRSFIDAGRSQFVAWDTRPDDLAGTSPSVVSIIDRLSASKASQIIFGFDLDGEPSYDRDELDAIFAKSPKAVGLFAAEATGPSLSAAALERTAWVDAIAGALTGQAANVASFLTATALQNHIDSVFPRIIRRHFPTNAVQVPFLLGEQNGGNVVADLSSLLKSSGVLLDPQRLSRVVFRRLSSSRVKDLAGFRRSFQVPDRGGPSARKFIRRCADAEIRADLDAIHAAAREHLGYKRKDLVAEIDPDGVGRLRTPDFEYTVVVEQDADDPGEVIWRREVGQLADANFPRSSEFAAVFGKPFDQLGFEFGHAVDVPAFVDRLEEAPLAGVRVAAQRDGNACEVTLAKVPGRIRVERHALTIFGRAGRSGDLIDLFLAFLRTFGDLDRVTKLPVPLNAD